MAQDLHRDTGMTQLQLQLQLQAGTAVLPTRRDCTCCLVQLLELLRLQHAQGVQHVVASGHLVRLKLRELLPKLHHSLSAQQRGCQFQYKAAGNVAQRNTPHDTGFTSLDSASHACFTSA